MKFRVTGADRESGRQVDMELEAETAAAAQSRANAAGILISSIQLIAPATSDSEPTPVPTTNTPRSTRRRQWLVGGSVIALLAVLAVVVWMMWPISTPSNAAASGESAAEAPPPPFVTTTRARLVDSRWIITTQGGEAPTTLRYDGSILSSRGPLGSGTWRPIAERTIELKGSEDQPLLTLHFDEAYQTAQATWANGQVGQATQELPPSPEPVSRQLTADEQALRDQISGTSWTIATGSLRIAVKLEPGGAVSSRYKQFGAGATWTVNGGQAFDLLRPDRIRVHHVQLDESLTSGQVTWQNGNRGTATLR